MVTIEEIFENMKNIYAEKTGYEINETADMAVRMYAAAAEICSLYAYNDWVMKQAFPQTATGENLEYHAQIRGLYRNGGNKATGKITFGVDEQATSDLTIPAGTVCYTQYGTRFVTDKEGIIAAGQLSTEVPASCENIGQSGNVAKETIVYMTVIPTGITYCINSEAFTGGTDDESDESLRERILSSYRSLPNGANKAFYEKVVLQMEQVAAVKVLPKNRGIGTVDVVIATHSGMPSPEDISEVKAMLDDIREICVDIEVLAPEEMKVTVDINLEAESGYTFSSVSNKVKEAIEAKFGGELLGKNVLLVELYNIIYNIEGVKNFTINSPSADIITEDTALPVLESVNVTNMGE